MLLLALGGGGVAFSCPLLVTDTTSWPMFLVAGLIGLSEAISAMATQTLLGRETPAHLRGSVTGAYTVIGMLGALAINSAGGFLFDRVSFVSPFVMVAVINIVCLIVCVLPGRQSFRSPLSR
jgi:MFS family permease